MQPSGGSSLLPPSPSPLPPPPFQQSYNPETGLTFTPSAGAASAPQAPPRKRAPKAAVAIPVIIIAVVVLAVSGVLDFIFDPSGSPSNQPDVKVTNTSASHTCPSGGTPTETFLFTLVNGGSTHANANIGFYLNHAQVTSGTYYAAAGTSTPYSATAYLSGCPPSGSTFYLELVSVTAA